MKSVLILTFIFMSAYIRSQSLSPEVFSSFGGDFSTGDIQLSFTGGEAVVSTIENSYSSLAQGFIQILEHEFTSTGNPLVFLSKVMVFPNPAIDNLSIQAMPGLIQKIMVIDMNGRQVLVEQPNLSYFSLNISDWAPGVYIVKVKLEEGEEVCKFIKK